jgi:folate-binding protein YgfZ
MDAAAARKMSATPGKLRCRTSLFMPGIPDQYRIIKDAAGWRRKSERGRLAFSGADRVTFLQALLTNDLSGLAVGDGCYAAYLTPQGRMIADLHLFVRSGEIVADVPASAAGELAAALDRLVFAEDVAVADASRGLAQFSVTGDMAPECLERAFQVEAQALRRLQCWSQLDIREGFVARTDDVAAPSWDVIVAAAEEGASPMTDELWTAMRVDAARPAFGIDMDRDTIPLEAGLLNRAISTTKGCYVGQEVVIRVLHRGGGRVARRLVKLVLDGSGEPSIAPGASVMRAGKDVGRLTTVSRTLDDSGIAALGYVHRDAAEIGNPVEVVSGSASISGHIAALAG